MRSGVRARPTRVMRLAAVQAVVVAITALGPLPVAAGEVPWTVQFGTSQTDWATSAAALGDGSVAVGGLMGRAGATGAANGFVQRYRANGTAVWAAPHALGAGGDDVVTAVASGAGGILVAGSTQGALQAGASNAGGYDAFVRLLRLDGTEMWTNQFGTAGHDLGVDIVADATGVFVVATVPSPPSSACPSVTTNVAVRRYDHSGALVRSWQLGGVRRNAYGATCPANDSASGIALVGTSFVVSGWTEGALPGNTQVGFVDAFAWRVSTVGATIWAKQFGASPYVAGQRRALATAVAADADGVYLAGQTTGPLHVGSMPSVSGPTDAFFLHLASATGGVLARDQFGGSGEDRPYAVERHPGGLHLVGSRQDSGAQPEAFLRTYLRGAAPYLYSWTQRTFGTAQEDSARAVALAPRGAIITGLTRGTLGTTALGSADAFVRAYQDEVAPLLSVPTARLDARALGALDSLPVFLTWTASDQFTGLATQTVQARLNGSGSFTDLRAVSAHARAASLFAVSGQSAEYRLTARDHAGNAAFSSGTPRLYAALAQESAATFSRDWAVERGRSSGYSGDAVRHSAVPGAAAGFAFKGTGELGIVSTRGPDRGKMDVLVDGALRTTIDLYAETHEKKRIVYVLELAGGPAPHSIVIRVSTASAGCKSSRSTACRVDVDAFASIKR